MHCIVNRRLQNRVIILYNLKLLLSKNIYKSNAPVRDNGPCGNILQDRSFLLYTIT